MHIPDQMLQGAVCPVTMAVALGGVTTAVVAATRMRNKPAVARFAAVTALIFAGQMLNFPVADGTSGHLLGGVLAVSLLGGPFAVLAMTLVVSIQALIFGDGGIMVLGANVVNMALIGVAAGALVQKILERRPGLNLARQSLLYGTAGWLSVMLASLAVCIELSASGAIPFIRVAPAMFGVHAWIGIGEGLITAAVFLILAQSTQVPAGGLKSIITFASACAAALLLSPLASGFPDGLEMIAETFSFLPDGLVQFAPMPGYQLPGIGNAALGTGLAGLVGVMLTFAGAWLVGWHIQERSVKG
jgi:cobalt/nickel transport system permease protein